MKLKLYLMLLALCGALTFQSCSDDDDPLSVSEAVQTAFNNKYPSVTNEQWEMKSGYYVAEFYDNGTEIEVWFTSEGQWCMTETDLRTDLTLLPQAVQTAFSNSAYSAWRVDDIDKYERQNETFYLIEVETNGQKDRNLYYGEDGTLLKDAEETGNDDVLPTTVI